MSTISIFNKEEFYLLKTEVISQLENKDAELLITDFTEKHTNQNDVKVKNALLNKLEVSEQTNDFFFGDQSQKINCTNFGLPIWSCV